MQMHAVNWFEIPVRDLERAKAFYEYVLGVGLSLNETGPLKMAWFPMEQGLPGSTGALVQAEGYEPSSAGTIVYFTVADLDAALERANTKGGKTLTPKMSVGEYGFVAHFLDSEGNLVALHSPQ